MLKQSLLAAALAAVSGSVFAASPVANLKIDGRVTPPTCTVNGAEQGEIVADFGSVSPSLIQKTKNLVLDTVTVPLTVKCDAITYLTFMQKDTYEALGDVAARSYFVDDDNKTAGVGYSFYYMRDIKVDGKNAYFGREIGGRNNVMDLIPVSGQLTAWTTKAQKDVALSDFSLAPGKEFSANLEVNGLIYSLDQLQENGVDLTSQVNYVGETVLTFYFGI